VSETFPTKTEIAAIVTSITQASEARILAALKAPAPVPDPMPGGGAPEQGVDVLFAPGSEVGRANPGGFPVVFFRDSTVTFRARCWGFDPRETGARWLLPNGDVHEPIVRELNGQYLADVVAVLDTPTAGVDVVATFFSGLDGRFAEMPLRFQVLASPKPAVPAPRPAAVTTARDWSILHDWPSSWPPVAEDGRMPQLPEARDVETLVLYARHGYERDGTPMRGPVSLGFAGNEVEAVLDLTDEAYRASRYGKAGVARDLACYGLLVKRIKIPYDLSPGAYLQNEPMTGVAYPSLEALLAREVDMFGGGDAGPGGKP